MHDVLWHPKQWDHVCKEQASDLLTRQLTIAQGTRNQAGELGKPIYTGKNCIVAIAGGHGGDEIHAL